MIPPLRFQSYPSALRFRGIVESSLGVPLESLHEHDVRPLVTRQTDQATPWHKRFYLTAQGRLWRKLYHRFLMVEVAPKLFGEFYAQTVPTFRVQYPQNMAVGEMHRDVEYGHLPTELTVWVPLTDVAESQSVVIEGQPHPMRFGDVLLFDAANCLHGNVVSMEAFTRVSFDFRVVLKSRYVPSEARSVNRGLRFSVGEYFFDPNEGT